MAHRMIAARKTALRIGLLPLLAGLVFSGAVVAQEFKPTKPIDIVVHTGPGAGSDVLAREVASLIERTKLSPARFKVVNKTGGGGLTAMSYLAEKKGDDYTIAMFTGVWLTNPLVRPEAQVTMKDLTPVARLLLEPALIVVKADAPYASLRDFIEAAKASPGKLKQSGGSLTSRDNIVRELLMKKTGAGWTYISFPGGGERMAALLGGHVNMMVIEPEEVGERIRAGQLKVLAQISERRLPGMEGIPTLKEAGYDVPVVPQVRGVVAPPGISKAAAAYYEGLFARLVKTEQWQKFLRDHQFQDGFQSGTELAGFVRDYDVEMRGILKDAGVKVVK